MNIYIENMSKDNIQSHKNNFNIAVDINSVKKIVWNFAVTKQYAF